MASKAARNAVTAIGLAHGVATETGASYPAGPPKTVAAMIERVHDACGQCFELWEKPDAREVKRINDRMAEADRIISPEGKAEVVTITAYSLMMLLDLRDRVSGRKRVAVQRLVSAMTRLNRYYDRRMDHWRCYDKAAEAVRVVERIEA